MIRDLVAADPDYFRGRAAVKGHAGAVCYLIAHANETVASRTSTLAVRHLTEPLGSGPPHNRATRFRSILGLPDRPWGGDGPVSLGSARYLVAGRRTAMAARRGDATDD